MVADDTYIRESILNPGSKVTAGFKPIMPTFSGLVSEDQLLSLISYVKSIAQPPGGQAATKSAAVSGQEVPGKAASTAGNAKVQ